MATNTGAVNLSVPNCEISDEYIRQVTNSSALRGSSSLPRLLRYLADRARDEPGENIKEFRIATEALGRGKDFDSRTDSVVRVTTARLRSKLEEYYAHEGEGDPIRLQVPKGSYRLVALPAPPPERDDRQQTGLGSLLRAGIAALLLLAALAAGFTAGRRWAGSGPQTDDPETARLWNELAGPDGAVRVIYSNVSHWVTSEGRVVASGDVAGAVAEEQWHTGVGEVEATLKLANLASRLGFELDLKRSMLVDWDEILDDNVVYLGGPGGNPQVAELGAAANFAFEPLDTGNTEQFVLRNRNPRQGEPDVLELSLPLERDYAVVRLTRGFRSDRWILLLAGITTFGTGAAAELASDAESLREIRVMLGRSLDDPVEPFECLVEVGIKDHVAFESRLLSCRPIEAADAP